MFSIDNNIIKLTRGDSATFTITVLTSEGEPYEMQDGDKIEFTLKNSVVEEQVLVQKQGHEIKLAYEDTKDLPFGDYVYDIQITFQNGDRDTIIAPQEDSSGLIIPNFILTREVNWE